MGFFANDYVLEGALERIAEADRLFLCSDEPATYNEASSTMMLAQDTLTPGDGNGDFTVADGDSNGRKVTVDARTIASASNSGTANHVALCDSGNSRVLWVGTLSSSIGITSGNPVYVPDFKVTVPDPS